MMVSGIATGSNFTGTQSLRALNAFKADEKTVREARRNFEEPSAASVKEPENQNVALRNDISSRKANEIKQYGQMFDLDISNSDINYALTYGRSIIVDYKA